MTTLSYAPQQTGAGTLFGTDPFAQLSGYGAQQFGGYGTPQGMQSYGPQSPFQGTPQFGFGPQQPMPITQIALIPIPWQGQPYGLPQQQYGSPQQYGSQQPYGGIPQLMTPLPVLVPLGTPQQYYPQQAAWQPYGQQQFQQGQFPQQGQHPYQQVQHPQQQWGQYPQQGQWGPQGQQFGPQTPFGFGPQQAFTQGYGPQRPMSY